MQHRFISSEPVKIDKVGAVCVTQILSAGFQ